jgi:phage terminase small subunit
MGALSTPADLGRAGLRLWADVCRDWQLGQADLIMLAEACRLADTLETMAGQATDEPVVITGRFGQRLPNPWHQERRAMQRTLISLFSALGLTADAEQEAQPAPRGRPRAA